MECSVMEWYEVVWEQDRDGFAKAGRRKRGSSRSGMGWPSASPDVLEAVQERVEVRAAGQSCGGWGFVGFGRRIGNWVIHDAAILRQPRETR